LTAGTYTGTLTISATGYNSATVAVTLVVTQPKAAIQITGSPLFTLANTAPPATTNLTIAVTDGSAQAFTITEGATNYPWLALSATSGTTPATIKLTATPTGLTPGVYVIPLTVTVPSLPVSTQVLYAQLTITGSNLVATPSMLTFTYQPGQVTPPAQSISLTTVTGGTVALASVSTDVGWLKVTPATSAPATLQVSISPGLLGAGMYSGDVIIKGVGSTQASLQIPVTLTVNALPPLTATPATLAFTYQIGGVVPAPQSFALAAGSAALNFTATSPGNWLVLNPTRGMTPGSVLVTVNPLGLAVGTYGGTINVSAIGASNSVPVAVTLTVTPSGPLTIAPSALTFSAPVGGPAPVAQALSVTSSGAALGFTASASSAWLSVSPASGTTPASLSVSVNPTGLASGTYTGAINITATGSAAQVVMVTLQVGGGGATPVIQGVINAASGAIGKVSPGMAISIFGTSLGPQTGVSFVLPQSGGALATTLGGTQVLFDGTPVAVLYASADQVNALVPYELANKANTSLQVEFDGVTSTGTTLTVLPAEPGLFAANGAGTGQGALLNQDSSVNSSTKPAAAGTVIQLFGTGGGVTIPPSVDGTLNPLVSTGALAASTTATVGGQTATVQYSGPAPGLVAGVIQVNVVIPSGTASGNIPVTIQVGGVTSQTVTVAVQ
jgi:uncharacterized protein (TIGR03437 family)